MTPDISKIPLYLEKGKYHKHWYEHEKAYLLRLLPEFADLPIIRVFAVTSMTTSIEANVHLAVKALQQMKRGLPFKGFLPTQITYLNLIKEGKDVPGRKIMSFIRALEGDPDAVVIDIWMCRAFGLIRERQLRGRTYFRAPSTKEYNIIEQYCISLAKLAKVEPRQFQSMVWAGIKVEESVISKNVSWHSLLQAKKGMFEYGQ